MTGQKELKYFLIIKDYSNGVASCKVTPKFEESLKRTHMTQNIVVLTGAIYYSKRIQRKINKEKDTWYEVQNENRYKFPSLIPVESQGIQLIPLAICCNNSVKCCLAGHLKGDSMPQVFIWGLLLKHLLDM